MSGQGVTCPRPLPQGTALNPLLHTHYLSTANICRPLTMDRGPWIILFAPDNTTSILWMKILCLDRLIYWYLDHTIKQGVEPGLKLGQSAPETPSKCPAIIILKQVETSGQFWYWPNLEVSFNLDYIFRSKKLLHKSLNLGEGHRLGTLAYW